MKTSELDLLIEYAREEAQRFGHEYLGTEHLLIAIARLQPEFGDQLGHNQIDARKIRKAVVRLVATGPCQNNANDLLLTPRAINAIEFGRTVRTNDDIYGSDQLLFALIHDKNSIARQVLLNIGLSGEQLENFILKTIDNPI